MSILKIDHEAGKCLVCNRHYKNTFLMNRPAKEHGDEKYIICVPCAKNVHNFVDKVLSDE